MKIALMGLLLMGCGLQPDGLSIAGKGMVPETKTCHDTTRVIGPKGVEVEVTERKCRTGEMEWEW